jgi:hypothetical protein
MVEEVADGPAGARLDPAFRGGDGLGRLGAVVVLGERTEKAGETQARRRALPAGRVGEETLDGLLAEERELGKDAEIRMLSEHRGHHRGV